MRLRPTRRALVAALVLAALAGACSGDDAGDAGSAPEAATDGSTTPLGTGDLGAIDLALVEVAQLAEPIALAPRAGTDDLYVAEKSGAVRRIAVTTDADGEPRYDVVDAPVLDLGDEVATGGERGLLGLAFSTDGRRLYLDYTRAADGATVVEAVELGDRTVARAADRRPLLVVPQPEANHNGGQLVLGPDGYLYVGLGDGGGAGDPDGQGQDTDTLLGSILRIDPDGGDPTAPPGPRAYAIPGGNPFAEGGGAPEIWLYGVRNPWRFTFDRATGDLWVADVGQNAWEEIDLLPATDGRDAGRGANLGWDAMEASHPFDADGNPPGAVLPIHEYGHEATGGCSVTGGYRYRGAAIPALVGVYLYADFCRSELLGLQLDEADAVVAEGSWDVPVAQAFSFGEDADGELYVLRADGTVLRLVAG